MLFQHTKKTVCCALFSALTASASGQSLTFKAPVNWDYDRMQGVCIADGHYRLGTLRNHRFVPGAHTVSMPLDGGREFAFGAYLYDGGDRVVIRPASAHLHEREAFLYTAGNKVRMAQNLIREEAEQRLDTTYMMSFKVRRKMTQDGLPKHHDGPFEIEFDLLPDDTTTVSALQMVNAEGDTLTLSMDHRAQTLTLACDTVTAVMPVGDARDEDIAPTWHVDAIVGRHSVEVFLNEGRAVMSRSIALRAPLSRVVLLSEGGKTKFSAIAIYRKPAAPIRLK